MLGLSHRHVSWDSLTARGQERVLMLIASLHEFHQGSIEAGYSALGNKNPIHPTNRFYRNILFAYLHAYYCAKGALVLPILGEIGRPDLARSITAILDRRVGSVLFREVISAQRNRLLAHQRFDSKSLRDAMIGDSKLGAAALGQLQRRTVALHVVLRKLYPAASKILDEAYM